MFNLLSRNKSRALIALQDIKEIPYNVFVRKYERTEDENDFFQLNKISELIREKNIIFCKTDYLIPEFKRIARLNSKVILISGNSDYPITDKLVKMAPRNIVKWFAQNAISQSEILEPLPLGYENKFRSQRFGHGTSFNKIASEKEQLIVEFSQNTPVNFLYANFNIYTNYLERVKYKELSIACNHIDWELDKLKFNEFYRKLSTYKMTLCPIGNGIDTMRLWEVLFFNRIPVTVKVGDFKIYKLYENLPIVILDKLEDLNDLDLLNTEYKRVMNRKFDKELLTSKYWIDQIISRQKSL